MGTTQSSPELTTRAMRSNEFVDTQLLMYSSLDLMDMEWVTNAYLECLQNGTLISETDTSWRLKKNNSLTQKAQDTNLVLSSSPHAGEFSRKQTKIFERIIAELTSNADPYHDIFQSRLALVKRVHIAYLRTRKREISEGKPCQMNVDQKRIWLSTLLLSGVEAESSLLIKWLDDFEKQETTERARQAHEAQQAKREELRRSLERSRDNVRQRINTLRTHLDVWSRQRSSTRSPQTPFNPYASILSQQLPSLPHATTLATVSSNNSINDTQQTSASSSVTTHTPIDSNTSSHPAQIVDPSSSISSNVSTTDSSTTNTSSSDASSTPLIDTSDQYQSFVAAVLQHVDKLPELIGLTGLLGVAHPKEKLIHQERLGQRRWSDRPTNGQRRDVGQTSYTHLRQHANRTVRGPSFNQSTSSNIVNDHNNEEVEVDEHPTHMSSFDAFVHPPHGRATDQLSHSLGATVDPLIVSAMEMARQAAERDSDEDDDDEDDESDGGEDHDMEGDANEYGSVPDSQDNSSDDDQEDNVDDQESYDDDQNNDDDQHDINENDEAYEMDIIHPIANSSSIGTSASRASSLISELSGALDSALSSNEDIEMLQAIALSLGLGGNDVLSASDDSAPTSSVSSVTQSSENAEATSSASISSSLTTQSQTPSTIAPVSSNNVDMDAELAASLLNGGEDEEFARAIALSLELSQPAVQSTPTPTTTTTTTSTTSNPNVTSTTNPTPSTATSGTPPFATICSDLMSHLDRLSALLQRLSFTPNETSNSSLFDLPSSSSVITSSNVSSVTATSGTSEEPVVVQPANVDDELSSLLSDIASTRTQLRTRCVEDRQAQFNSGQLSNQRHDEQHALTIVTELETQVRDLMEQSRRYSSNTSVTSSSLSAPVGSNVVPHTHSDRHSGVWTNAGLTNQSNASVPRTATGRSTSAVAMLDENDLKFNCGSLLDLVLKQANTQSLASVDRIFAVGSDTSKQPITSSIPAVRLLHMLQLDLFRKGALATESSEPIVGQLVSYVCNLLEVSRGVLERVTTHSITANSMESDCSLAEALYHSVVGICTPPVILSVYHLLHQPAFVALSSTLCPILNQLVGVLNSVANMFIVSKKLDVIDIARPSLFPHSMRVVESAHAYLANQNDEHVITIPGADFLSLEFDPRCSTERNRDVLDILGEDHTLVASLEGENDSWPTAPVVVQGSSVIIRFHAESINPSSRFGYRIVVRGMQFPSVSGQSQPSARAKQSPAQTSSAKSNAGPSSATGPSSDPQAVPFVRDPVIKMHTLPFLFDMLNMTCRLLGRCAHLTVIGESTGLSEKRLSKWLASPLFSQGFEKNNPSADSPFEIKSANEPPPALPEIEPAQATDTIPPTSNIDPVNTAASLGVQSNAQPSVPVKPSVDSVMFSPLDDRVVIGSGKDAEFLTHFVDLQVDSDGAAFDTAMRKLVRPVGPEMLGGVIVKRTVRCFVAALLKHMGLTSSARSFVREQASQIIEKGHSTSSSASSLIDVWKKGSLMHRWIVSQRQSLQQLHLARQQQLEAEGKPMSADQLAAIEKRLEYEGFCSGLFNKSLYLLSVRPCLTHPPKHVSASATPGLVLASEVSNTLALSRTLSNELTLVRTNSSGGRARDSNESFMSLFSVYKTLQHFNAYKADKHRDKDSSSGAEENVIDLLALFVQSDVPVSEFARMIASQAKRAHQRLITIDMIDSLIQSLHFSTCCAGLLHFFSNPFRAYQRYAYGTEQQGITAVGSHYYTNIESCDVRVRGKVRQSFLRLYKRLAAMIGDSSSAESLRLIAMDCWGIEFIPLDHSQLMDMGILSTLQDLIEAKHSTSSTIHQVARTLNRLLFASQIRFDTKTQLTLDAKQDIEEDADDDLTLDSDPWVINPLVPSNGLDRLQQHIVDTLFMSVYHSVSLLVELRHELGHYHISDLQLEQKPPSSITSKQYLDAEEAAYLSLASLSSMVGVTKHVLQHVISKNVLQLLLKILEAGSPRLQRMSLGLFVRLFTQLSVSQFDALQLNVPIHPSCPASSSTRSVSFVHYILASIGSLSFGDYRNGIRNDTVSDEPAFFNPYDHRSGAVNLSLAAAYIAFLREIMYAESLEAHDQSIKCDMENETKRNVDDEVCETQDTSIQSHTGSSDAVLGWTPLIVELTANSLSSLTHLSSHQRSSGFSLDAADDSLCSPEVYPSVLLALASVSVLGGYDDRIRVGGCVQINSDSTSPEMGTVVFLDREASQVKVVFDHSPNKVVECQITKLRPFVLRSPNSSLLLHFPGVLRAFNSFIDGLLSENKAALQQKALRQRQRLVDYEREREEAETQRLQAVEQAPRPVAIDDYPWECETCTFLNTSSLRAVCEMCGCNNPLAHKLETASRNLKPAVVVSKPKTPRTALLQAAEGEEERSAQIELVTPDQFLYHALRSRAVQAMCHLLGQPSSARQFLSASKLLPELLSLATRPTMLNGFHSVSQLGQRDDRLLELLQEKSIGMANDHKRFLDRAKGVVLQHSPFAKLDVLLPNSWDLGVARSVSFTTDDCSTVQYSRQKDVAVAVVRSNHLIPNSLPAFYFEITVLDSGTVEHASNPFGLAVGLFRSGMALKGFPGSSNSYALSTSGELHSTQSGGTVHRRPFAKKFKTGDVIGCLWNLRKKHVQFSLNGSLIDVDPDRKSNPCIAFSGVDGRFHPAVWIEADNACVSANWGQNPFKYDFLSTLPFGYLASMPTNTVEPRSRTAAEIKRRTQAEDLALITSFPIDLCEIALEQKSDDMERAVDFLLQHGNQELERMAAESIRQSQLTEDNRKMRILGVPETNQAGEDDDDEPEDLAEWLTGSAAPAASQANAAASNRTWASVGGSWLGAGAGPQQQQSASARRPNSSSTPASMLDDEIEQDIPVGVELPSNMRNPQHAAVNSRVDDPAARMSAEHDIRTQGAMQDALKIDDIACGHVLAVCDNASNIAVSSVDDSSFGLNGSNNTAFGDYILPVSHFCGRSGIVCAVDVNTKSVQLLFVDNDVGVKHCCWFPISACTKPPRLWADPCFELRGVSWKAAAYEFIVNEQALSVRNVRSAIQKLFGSWPEDIPFSLESLGGPAAVMDMLKLSASEVLSSSFGLARIQSLFSHSTKSMEAFQTQLAQLIRDETHMYENDHSLLPDVCINESMYNIKQADVLANMLAKGSESRRLLIPRIVEEIIVHFVQAVNHPIPTLTFRSPHPYPSHSDLREKVSIPGASKLLVTFDPACQISEDMLTRLAFCRDSSYQDVIMTCTGRYGAGHGQRWQSFMVTGDTLYFKFSSGVNTENWGYKFKVTPVELRINDEAALNGLNIELGAWLFEFFLTQASGMIVHHYARDIYDAIVFFVIHAKPSAKSRGVELLVRFLLHVHHLSSEVSTIPHHALDFSKLAPLQAQMNQVLDSMNEVDYRGGLSSPALQGLIELLATTDLVKSQSLKLDPTNSVAQMSALDKQMVVQSDATGHGSPLLDVSSLGVYSLKLQSARYFPAQQESMAVDVTSSLKTYMESCGSSQLYLPLSASSLEKIIGLNQWSGREKRLHMRYSIVRRIFDSETSRIQDLHIKDVEKTVTIPATISRNSPNPCLVLKALPSPFDGIVELSRFTLEMQATGEFVGDVKQEIIRAQKVASTFFPLVSADGLKLKQQDRLVVPDSSGVQGSSFTFMTWIYVPDTARTDSVTDSKSSSPGAPVSVAASSISSPTNRRVGRTESVRLTATPTSTTPLRCLLHKGNYNAELALSSAQSSGWSHAQAHLYSSGVSITLGPQDDNRVSLTLYSFRNPPQQLTSTQSLPVNQWSHVAVTVTRHSARIVINGVEDVARKLQGHRKISNDPFFLGKLPIGTFDISDERYGAMQRGQGFEDESRRTGLGAVVKDARWVGYSIEPKDLLWYFKCVTKHSVSFKSSDVESPVTAVWKEKKPKKTDVVVIAIPEPVADAQPVTTITSEEVKTSEVVYEPLSALFSQGPQISVVEMCQLMSAPSGPRFTPAMDSQVIEYATNQLELEMHRARAANSREQGDATGSVIELQAYSPNFVVNEGTLASYHLISQISPGKIRDRLVAIQTVNSKLAVVLPLVDFSQAAATWSLAHRLSSMSWLILREVKTRTWSAILRQTGNQGTTTFITINRPRALRAKEKGDLSGLKSVFGQVYCQLHFLRPSSLRTDQRPWRATFEGEGGTDAGGLFRDSVSHMCSELQSSAIPLFITCPNNRTKIGDNQDKWIPHPASTSSVHASMFAFVGKLMGIAIRGGHMLNLDFPPLIFKPLVGAPISRADLAAVDALTFDVLDKISSVDESQAEDLMNELALTFTTMSSDGRLVELKPAGATLPVTAANRAEYCSLVENYRLHEFDVAIAAIRKGLSTIVPIQLLPLFTPSELESMICGKREISIDYLRANTRYRSPISPNDRHVAMLWDVLSSFSHEERQLFIRFAWGQSRLPSNPADFTQKFEIWHHPTNNDNVLPVSHTCFFSLELPRYSTYEIMRNKLLYAINNGYAIDTDHVADNLDWNAD